ncbi:EthD domain-containing protein [Microbacterium trichothecenolyticum]|uniref:EthD domain-containing protein n=1 Tax=Microbacterium trichothecenolyticum TaxID=69370 RepID=UPI001C6E0EE0|nr:EthD domain-containing protein [Microbacterium trichothecenolyticum]MBW9120493.1 EthD domain-containing protein [Microbacterium trichothecenolyticum]
MTPAFKLVLLLRSSDAHDADAFTQAWSQLDAEHPLEASGLVAAAFNAPVAGRVPISHIGAAPFDAAFETWWTRKNDAADWVVSHAFSEEWLPRRQDLLAVRPTGIGGAPQVLWESDAPVPPQAVKVFTLPVSRRRLSFAEFSEHWTGPHAQLALDGPGTRERLLRLEDTPAPLAVSTRLERGRYDGVGALTFASLDALEAEFATEHYREKLAADELVFTEPEFSAGILTREISRI